MSKILLDSSIIIDYLRLKDKSQTVLYNLLEKEYQLYTSIVAHTESYAGKSVWEIEKARVALETLFSGIKILQLDEEISKKAGRIRAAYGTNIVDAVIAATALSHDLELATLNTKDFEKIEGLMVYRKATN
ncbi:MAG: type II toxin-antitoxin system VapC family toxin [Candidatus Blackburnbacteria bacterium]|nr:type II toxin-antitoxin system VapC family toxin [Candidatus Blackburnbacteria bacterium]